MPDIEGELKNEYEGEGSKLEELKLENPQKPDLKKGVYQSKKGSIAKTETIPKSPASPAK